MNPLQPIVDLFDGLRDGIYVGPMPDDVREAILDGYRKTFAADFEAVRRRDPDQWERIRKMPRPAWVGEPIPITMDRDGRFHLDP